MKIICTKEEFARLVRFCSEKEHENMCRGCIFECVCTQHEEWYEGAWLTRIEDVCEIVSDIDG